MLLEPDSPPVDILQALLPASLKNNLALAAGPAAAFAIAATDWLGPAFSPQACMGGLILWMALWWMLEPVHLAVTSLLPIVLMPMLAIADVRDVAAQYMDQIIFLFIGGFLLAFAVEKHGLHKRIARFALSKAGTSPRRVLLAVMGCTWFMSMWVSNTATVMMMLAAVMAIAQEMSGQWQDDPDKSQRFGAGLLTGLAFSATIGGMATLVGTPPNMVFYRYYLIHYADHGGIDFVRWFAMAAPVSLLFLLLSYLILSALFMPKATGIARKPAQEKISWSVEEKRVGWLFLLAIVLWFTREGIQSGGLQIPGWSQLFPKPSWIQDSTVAVAVALLLFLIPGKSEPNLRHSQREKLLEWKDAAKLPLHVILLFGSGFALAFGFEQTGLSNQLAHRLSGLQDIPLWQLQLIVVLLVTLVSEFASNVASIQLLLPVLLTIQNGMNLDPLSLMLPATLAASMGFMLPIATAPNTIVFGAGRIRSGQMMRAGLLLDLTGICLIMLLCVLFLNR
jgi:sodium-dependent dicarboxylate transporter 2/3/5